MQGLQAAQPGHQAAVPAPQHIEDLSTKLEGMKVFSTINLWKGYWQVPVVAADVPKMAVITTFGLCEFLRLPFGLNNVG